MHRDPSILRRAAVRFLILLAASVPLSLTPRAQAQINTSIDQTIWTMLYGVSQTQINSSAWLTADDDGDGLINDDEMIAGTNPFNAGSTLGTTAMTAGTNGFTFTFPTVAGKLYSLQSSMSLSGSQSWSDFTPEVQVEGTGGPMMLASPGFPANGQFYRVNVQDVDSVGDGISDWARDISGFNPQTTGTGDQATLEADLAMENVVTITAAKATATEPVSGSAATDNGTLTVTRGGVMLFSAITVPLNWGGTATAGLDYTRLPASVTIPAHTNSVTISVVPLANPNLQTGATVTATVMPGGGYTVGSAQSASVVINPAGNTNGTGLTGMYFNSPTKTMTPYPTTLFAGTPVLTRVDPTVSFNWAGTSPGAGVSGSYIGISWRGQVQPQYSETYYFDATCDDGCMLWVNGQLVISSWSYIGTGDRLGSITLQAGVYYDIRLDYYQAASASSMNLYWYSSDQPRQIIPMNRLYPLSSAAAPPAITSSGSAVGFVNQPFSFNVTASTSGGVAPTFGLGPGSGPLPPGLTLNATTGLISGTPTAVGSYQVSLTASNPQGIGASVLSIQILPPGSGVTRELWNSLSGSGVSDIPLTTTPASIDTQLSTLEDDASYANNTGERLRGYFTAPLTGNYYFWLSASNNAELWISDDNQPVNLVRRAWVAAPGTGSEDWNNAGQTNQQSQWLSLTAGQQYYYEVYHNTGASSGTSSNVAVAWLMDTTGTFTSPTGSGVVPAYLLTAYTYPTATATGGTIYSTDLSPVSGVTTSAAGSASMQLNAAQTQAIVQFNYTGLSSPQTSYAIYGPDDNGSTTILFDLNVIDEVHPNLKTPAGYIWNIASTGAASSSTIVNDIQQGLAFLMIETVNNSSGEIQGNFFQVNGSETAPTPVPDPGFTDDSSTDAGAARFLNQSAFGASPADLAAVESEGYSTWITNQMALPATHTLPVVTANAALVDVNPYASTAFQNAWWNVSINAPDQLRQRVALALSEILVVSDQNASLSYAANGLGSYYDTLLDNAFGNFRTLLQAATLQPAMGSWLNMQGNTKGNLATGYHPDENYAREIMQLFTIGLNRLWPDGSTVLNSLGQPVPTYSQGTITNGFARVFTGWTWNQALQASGQLPTSFFPATNWTAPMVMVKNYHELGTKTILDNVVLPAATGYSLTAAAVAGSQADTTGTAYDSYCLSDLQKGLDNIFYHSNVGPYVCRELIQRLVESNPSPGYLGRVVAVFNDDGTSAHVRGNMAAVVRAILMDGEARNPAVAAANAASGKQREPLLRIAGPARTFLSSSNSGTYTQSGSQVMTITTNTSNEHSAGDSVWLDFSSNATGTPAVPPTNNPTTAAYTILASPVPSGNSFSVNATGITAATYSEAAGSSTLTINTSGPPPGESLYLDFPTGALPNGVYVVTGTSTSPFTVTTSSTAATALSGTVLVPKLQAYIYVVKVSGSASTITMTTNSNGNLNVGDPVWLQMSSGFELSDGQYNVASITGPETYVLVNTGTFTTATSNACTMYPLVPPPLTRSGTVSLGASAFNMGNTNSVLAQTPLDSPTVFNFYYPNYEYPGSLATYNITTPEFQLSTATNIVNLTNTIESTILASSNTNGLSNFQNGSIYLDLSAYMVAPYVSYNTVSTTSGTKVTAVTTSTVNYSALVTKLNNILAGGMLTQTTQQAIITLISSTAYYPVTSTVTGTTSAPPAAPSLPTTQARDIVRAAVESILTSPEYSIQQ